MARDKQVEDIKRLLRERQATFVRRARHGTLWCLRNGEMFLLTEKFAHRRSRANALAALRRAMEESE